MRHAIIAVLALLLLAAPARSEEVLYCVDEGAAGLKWDDEGNVQIAAFNKERFTVRVVSKTERWVSTPGGLSPVKYSCSLSLVGNLYFCGDIPNPFTPIIFGPNGYTRAFLAGPTLDLDPNIIVRYGTCTKF